MLTGNAALVAAVGTVAFIILIVWWFKRLLARMEKAKRAAEAAFLAGLRADRNIDEPDKDGLTPLLRALIEDWDQAIAVILARRPDPNLATPSGDTALHLAANRADVELTHRLLALEARTDVRNDAGETPLWVAAGSGAVDVVTRLHQAGAELDARDARDHLTPLMIAARRGRAGVVERLLELGADPRLRDHEGHTAADLGGHELGRNMGAYNDSNLALKNMVLHLRAAEAGHAFVPRQRNRPGDEYDSSPDDGGDD